jgi:hypothetical protein
LLFVHASVALSRQIRCESTRGQNLLPRRIAYRCSQLKKTNETGIKAKVKIEMQDKSNNKSIYCYLILILICLISCQEKVQENGECSKFIHEKYLEKQFDSVLVKEASEYREILLKRFDEISIKGINHEAYHLQFYSSHGFGKSVKFEKNISGCSLNIKCISKVEWSPDCENYQIRISEEEWNEFEKMIYEFNFWTEEEFRGNKNVLDGYVYFLEGNRPEAKKCNKRTYQLIGRGSPRFDKIGALCDYISEYEYQLALRYGKREIK